MIPMAGGGPLLLCIVVVCVIATASPGRADSSRRPEKASVFSPSRTFEGVVVPSRSGIGKTSLTLWAWRQGARRRVCSRRVVNALSPVGLIVTDSGYVVSFDDWNSAGYEHALVVYDPSCRLVRDAALEELVSPDDLKRVERSSSSRHWRYDDEPPVITDATVSITSRWGTTLQLSLRDGATSWSGPPFKHLTRFVRGGLDQLYEAGMGQSFNGRYVTCQWKDEQTSCQAVGEDGVRPLSKAKVPRAALRGRLEPALDLLHLLRIGPPCAHDCPPFPELSLEFRQGAQSYKYAFSGNTGAARESEALRALKKALGFEWPSK
jgi:hypothetical protein